ncbi:MAG TPA: ABC transporter permease, partial [Lachnospiraceae bacterium]|nr:ABC transporter permease [Lachnospiraceae bacterium]
MRNYVFKRAGLAVVTVLLISMITFFAMNAIPGGPFDSEKATSPEVRAVLEARYNLDKPVWEQYTIYMKNLFRG